LQFIHAALRHVIARGFTLVPAPLETTHHTTYVRQDGYLWELTPWMPGQADLLERLDIARLRTALVTLAQFHRAAEDFPFPGLRSGPAPGILSRARQLERWLHGDLDRLRHAIQPDIWPELGDRARRICQLVSLIAPRVAGILTDASQANVPWQAVIGDIWHDHVLFVGDHVTGLIDFGSMRVDSVAADVARLLGSVAGDNITLWNAGLEAYQTVRPLSSSERLLVQAFDRSTILMAGLNWVEWLFQERRAFEAAEKIPSRLDRLIERMEHLARPTADAIWYP
jgi:homoserine kinase type II